MSDEIESRGILELATSGAGAARIHRFAHSAMATTFEIMIAGGERRNTEQAARAAFDELDRLERALSRFVERGDIARLNALAPGRTILLGIEALECLRLAAEVHAATGGAFDVTVGPLVEWWRNHTDDPNAAEETAAEFEAVRARVGMHLIDWSHGGRTVGVRAAAMCFDLGGIGKGYALDQMARLLREDWGIESAALHGGLSTALAFGDPGLARDGGATAEAGGGGWPVALRDPENPERRRASGSLSGRALSGSAVILKGAHIIDPRTGRPAASERATWAIAPSAALSDALSTGFMMMGPEEIAAACAAYPGTGAMVLLDEGLAGFGEYGDING